MATPKFKECECAFCSSKKPFVAPAHLLDQIADGNVVVFAGAGISTENKDVAVTTLYEEIAHELGELSGLNFPALMTKYCAQPDGRIRLLSKIKDRFDYFRSFDDFYREMTHFHRAVAAIHTINDIITTNWDDFFERESEFSPFVYDSDLAFWDSSKRRVMKIHGSIANLGSIVATESDYNKSFSRLSGGPLGAHLRSLISRKTVVYSGYSLSDENYIRILKKIARMMGETMRQSYFVSPRIDRDKLSRLPIPLIPIETDGAYFFEQVRIHLGPKIGITTEAAFDECERLLYAAAEEHDRTADFFLRRPHPLLPFILSYQDGLVHAFQRISRKRRSGEYHSVSHVHQLVHGYEHKYAHYHQKQDYWNSSYARGYQNGLLFLLVCNDESDAPVPPMYSAGDRIFSSLSSATRVPRRELPEGMLTQFERLPIRDKHTGKLLIPDHTPYL